MFRIVGKSVPLELYCDGDGFPEGPILWTVHQHSTLQFAVNPISNAQSQVNIGASSVPALAEPAPAGGPSHASCSSSLGGRGGSIPGWRKGKGKVRQGRK